MARELFVQVEHDLRYYGGDYDKVGQFAYVPLILCERLGVEEAFRKHTGFDPAHIIHYTWDELYDRNGNYVEEEEEDEVV